MGTRHEEVGNSVLQKFIFVPSNIQWTNGSLLLNVGNREMQGVGKYPAQMFL